LGISAYVLREPEGTPSKPVFTALYGELPAAIEVAVLGAMPDAPTAERTQLSDALAGTTTELRLPNERFIRDVAQETYRDILASPTLKGEMFRWYPEHRGPLLLERLPNIGDAQIQLCGGESVVSGSDYILRLAEVNLLLAGAAELGGPDLHLPAGAEHVLRAKYLRAGFREPIEQQFVRLLKLLKVPDPGPLVVAGELDLTEILRLRRSARGMRFREWLQRTPMPESDSFLQAYMESLTETPYVSRWPARLIRLAVTELVGAASPVAGTTLSVADSLFIERWFAGYAPRWFLDELRRVLPPSA
jgi:hypothetical protein